MSITGDSVTTGVTSATSRSATVANLKTLKSPEEGGTKKEYEDFLERIGNHATITWDFGEDITYILENNEKPTFPEPTDLTDDEKKNNGR